jgi:molybdenum cofactor synthesis domain-containing protein
MIPIEKAMSVIARECVPLEPESVLLGDAVGRVLAQDVAADIDLPPFDRSQMDGFAVRSSDTGTASELRIIGESVAGFGFDGTVGTGEAVRIMTGARVPNGADAVEQVENAVERNGEVTLAKPVTPGRNIVRRAAEIAAGDLVFRPGIVITDKMIATLSSFGLSEVTVSKQPSLAILATGSEIVDVSERPGRDKIRNSNSPMLAAFARSLGIAADVHPLVGDDLGALTEAIGSVVTVRPDILVVTGGVSVGDYDFTKLALRAAGAQLFFEKISLKPGKPTVFGRIGETLVFGLPGNPVSVAVTFHLFVRFALLSLQNAALPELRRGTAVASSPIRGAKERDCLLPVSLSTDKKGTLIIETLRFSGSSNFIRFAAADALVHIPQGTSVGEGEPAEIYFL